MLVYNSAFILESGTSIVDDMIKKHISEIFLQQLFHLLAPIISVSASLIVIGIFFVLCRITKILCEKLGHKIRFFGID